MRPSAPGSRTTRLELYFDLVFVFAFLTVTTLTANNSTVRGLVQGLLVLALLWWCWTGFAALGNVVRTDQGVLPLVAFLTTAALFVLAVGMPQAFVDQPGGLPGPLVFAACYLVVRAAQVGVLGWVVRADPRLRRRWLLLALPPVVATVLLVTAALAPQRFAGGQVEIGVRLGLWIAALAVEYGVGLLLWGTGWVVVSAGHLAERHALIILVALGESIIALGTGSGFVTGLPLSWPVILAGTLGIVVVAAFWWSYFDTLALAMEQTLHRTRERAARLRLARDAYTYLHLPLIVGVILFALGLKGQLAEAADPLTPRWGERIETLEVLVLYGGAAVYLATLVILGWRVLRTVRWPSVAAVAAVVLLAPVARQLPELIALGVLAVSVVAAAAAQTVVDTPRRRQVRQVALEEQLAGEVDQTRWRGEHL
ncbi:low temperature requirement protein A [Micromonospora endolithica]|uniref:Low temperature requirement protein A n=1 Tax=Micromonospora endolithica TaxID=230091 RepID=A0A3A9ZSY0_9ACTN|nr:low temperature requirement protein A [Micromonospora endolithica]